MLLVKNMFRRGGPGAVLAALSLVISACASTPVKESAEPAESKSADSVAEGSDSSVFTLELGESLGIGGVSPEIIDTRRWRFPAFSDNNEPRQSVSLS